MVSTCLRCPIISIDKSKLIYNAENDFYYATNEFSELCGYLGKSDSFTSFKIEIYDILDTLIYTNEIERQFEWKDSNIGLMSGLNKIVLSAIEDDGKEYTCTMKLMVDSSKFVNNLQVDLEDNDNDGLWNYIEIYLGTDPDKYDTDNDNLNDWVEVYVLGYNPLFVDTNNNGVSDGDEDEDEDGLTNAFEVNEFSSSPIAADTDHEGLADNEEYECGTSPTMRDTDEDGINDYDEIYLFKLDPLVAQPSDIKLTKTFTIDDMTGEYDEAVYPTITVNGDINCIKNFTMNKLNRTTVINPSTVGYLGAAYDFRTNGRLDGATLTFTYDPDLIMEFDQSAENFIPTIYYFNEETCDFEEVPNQTWIGNQVTAELEHFSIYLLLNKITLQSFWNSVIEFPEAPDEEPVQIKRQIAFLLDRSESMDWNDEQNLRGKLTREFCNLLEPTDTVSFYGFSSYNTNYNNHKFISDSADINNAIDKFIDDGNYGSTYIAKAITGVYNDLIKAKNEFDEANKDTKTVLCQYVFLLTDGQSSDTPSATLLKDYYDNDIKIYTVGFGDADLMYLRMISDATDGKSYSADSISDLEDIYLKFNDEIEATDANKDGISDYYEYLMCQGIITTRAGTRVFEGYSYEEVMANADLDNDGLKNGEEVIISEFDFKPYALVFSDPTLQYTDRDSYNDFQEVENGTSSHSVDYLISKEDYLYLLNGSNFSFTTSANKYLNEFSGKLAFNYFVDVVFCGSESYFDTIKQGAQDGYFLVTGQGGKVGSENMLMKQEKALLAEYLSKIMELPDTETNTDALLEFFYDGVENSLEFYECVEKVMKEVKKDSNYAISNDVVKFLTNKELQKKINEERNEIRKLQSELDIARRTAAINRTPLTSEQISDFSNRQREISRRQSEIDTNVFRDANSPSITNRYKKISDTVGKGFDKATMIYSGVTKITELIKYSYQLAAFEQYREFITELSRSENDDYVAVAAEQLLKDMNDVENSGYWGRGSCEFFNECLNMAVDEGMDKVLEKCAGTSGVIFEVCKLVIGGIVGDNLSYDRQNLLSADLSTQIAFLASDKIDAICGPAKKLSNNQSYYVASGANNCITATQYMIYFIATRQFGEEKYVELGEDESGILGWFGYNTIEHKYGTSSIIEAKSNAKQLRELINNYDKVFNES